MVPAGKSGGKHEDGRFWRMKVGKEGIDDFEFETRIDKNVVFAFGFAGFGPEFERASYSGADGNDAVASGFGGLDGRDGFGWNLEPFGMHVVFFDIVATDWQESAKTNVKSEILNLYVFGLEFGEGCFGHVEAGGWGGGRTEFFGPDGLVALDVVGIGVEHKPGGLAKVLSTVRGSGQQIEYAYSIISGGEGQAAIVMQTSDNEACMKALADAGITLLSNDDLK